MRTPIIAGNWKMNNTPAEARALIADLIPKVADAACEVVVCVPFTALAAAAEALKGTNIALGAQNIHWAQKGAFTGEISADMLSALGVRYAIVGHSERRQYFGETDLTVNQRTVAAVTSGITPIVCVGETRFQREAGYTTTILSYQTRMALTGLDPEQVANLVIAYEPVWAIGTGLTASDEQAGHTIGVIREVIAEVYGQSTADRVRIQYGGSMNPQNAHGLMQRPEIDGGLIGGASLKADDFAQVVHFER
ncbi:MAG: triose-phosphate isomerase [Oscillospiraceae bacterium]|jgi:triosephosphate isomerase|nr:triose-phosphate isomerase [Oscillospiraceae bacterium]